MNFSSVNDLRKFLTTTKLKFCMKIHHILTWTYKHPEDLLTTGGVWCPDGFNFICNAFIVGNFIKIKPNSINTNFRSHSFEIVPFDISTMSPNHKALVDPKNWRKRYNKTRLFTIKSSPEEINMIRCISSSPKSNDIRGSDDESPRTEKRVIPMPELRGPPMQTAYPIEVVSRSIPLPRKPMNLPPGLKMKHSFETALPDAIYALVGPDSTAFLNTELVYRKMKGSPESRNAVATIALSEWKEFSDSCSSSFSAASNFISQVSPPQLQQQVFTNVSGLLHNDNSSQENLCFSQYLRFVAQYGSRERAVSSISELSLFGGDPTIAAFQPWFKPWINDKVAVQILDESPPDTWLVRPSSAPGMFALHVRSAEGQTVTHIDFNACEKNGGRPLSVISERDGLISAGGWIELLFGALQLPTSPQPEEEKQIQYSGFSSQGIFFHDSQRLV